MSNIEYSAGASFLFNHGNILQNKINSVCKKIGFDDSKIRWVIYSQGESFPKKSWTDIRTPSKGLDCGFCSIEKNEIWISTFSINQIIEIIPSTLKTISPKYKDFLADVLLDEITHIQTGCDHGTPKYDEKLLENEKKYYSGLF